MTLRPATASDRAAVVQFLRRHEAGSVFPLANLAGRGPSAQDMWLAGDPVEGVIALGHSGFLMPQWPGLDALEVLRALRGQRIAAVVGPADQVAPILDLLPDPPRRLSREPLCTLDLAELILPDPAGCTLSPIRPQDFDQAVAFRMAFDIETIGQDPATAREKAEADVTRWLKAGSHRLLWQGGQAVALTGMNAQLTDVVQVGGVFVPQALRSRGLARRAVGLHLAEARAAGAARAVLFAANDAALAAYRALGFGQVGWMSVALLRRAVLA